MDTEDVRLAVYRSFAVTGRAPERGSLDERALRALHEQRHVVLGADEQIVMAHPFSAVPLGFSVMGRATLWWGGCAWDSFALAHLLPDEPDVLVATRCPGCDAALAWVVGRDAAAERRRGRALPDACRPHVGRRRAHVRPSTPVLRRGLRRRVAGAQRARARLRHGSRHALAPRPRLVRRAGWSAAISVASPSEAREYFRSVGLSGPFWGL